MSKQITLIGEILIDTIKSVKIIIEQTEKSKPFIYTKNGDPDLKLGRFELQNETLA